MKNKRFINKPCLRCGERTRDPFPVCGECHSELHKAHKAHEEAQGVLHGYERWKAIEDMWKARMAPLWGNW